MNQDICNGEYRILVVLSDVDHFSASVLLDDDAVNGQRNSHPLILFDAAVIVGIQIGKTIFFVKRILLQIETRGIDMRTQNIHAMFQRFFSNMVKGQRLLIVDRVDFVARVQRFALCGKILQVPVPGFFRHLDGEPHTFTLCFADVDAAFIALCYRLHLLQLFLFVNFP